MNQIKFSIPFKCSLTEIVEKNHSFDAAKLKIAYHGHNRKNLNIDKSVFEDAIPSLYYCPIVCNYNVEDDAIGSHDMQLVSANGGLRLINLTHPVGVVPDNANVWWETLTEDDGSVHEYMCCDVLLWKRQPAYNHLVTHGVTDQSMEINISAHEKTQDGVTNVLKFEFEALCLLESEPPCFESAALKVSKFSASRLQSDLMDMVSDFKREFSMTGDYGADKVISFAKGGDAQMNLQELLAQYNLTEDSINFDLNGLTPDEIAKRLAAIAAANQIDDDDPDEEPDGGDGSGEGADSGSGEGADLGEGSDVGEQGDAGSDQSPDVTGFSMTVDQTITEICNVLHGSERIKDSDYGYEYARYSFIDFDMNTNEVYMHDRKGNIIVGAPYTMSGDSVVIDFTCVKRKKTVFVDFENEPENADPIITMADQEMDAFADYINNELNALREFKASIESEQRESALSEVFSAFSDLSGDEAFEALRGCPGDMTVEQIEEKCFAIRGRRGTNGAKFSMGSTRIPVDQHNADDKEDPYHGAFRRYGVI